jgi:hypothetical protein
LTREAIVDVADALAGRADESDPIVACRRFGIVRAITGGLTALAAGYALWLTLTPAPTPASAAGASAAEVTDEPAHKRLDANPFAAGTLLLAAVASAALGVRLARAASKQPYRARPLLGGLVITSLVGLTAALALVFSALWNDGNLGQLAWQPAVLVGALLVACYAIGSGFWMPEVLKKRLLMRESILAADHFAS